MSLSAMYRALLLEQEDAWDDVREEGGYGLTWMSGYAQGVNACIQIVRDHLLAEDTEDA